MIKYIFLGAVQGLTEFLPVSSSGHLVIIQKLLGMLHDQIALSVVLHLGTAAALVVFFFKDLLGLIKDTRLLLLILVTTVITSVIGLAGKDFFEQLFNSAMMVGFAWICTGVLLLITKKFSKEKKEEVNFKDAAVLGLTQSIAIIPGISRSGMTISTLLLRGINRENSFRFAFLIAIPVILGAAVVEGKEINFALQVNFANFISGFIASFLTGIFSLRLIKVMVRKAQLHYFGIYCIAAGIATILFIR